LRSVVLPLGLVVLIVGGLLYFQSNRGGGTQEDGFGTVELPSGKNATSQPPAAVEQRAAPDFLLRDLDGEAVRLSDLQGNPVVVNFWATWCPTCRSETPGLIATYETYRGKGLQLLGVDLREAQEPVAKFADDFGMTYPVLLDRNGEVSSTWRIGGPNNGVPATYFIDSDGVVRKVIFGYVSEALMAEGLALIFEGS
jgi:peroxiredoxin